MRIALYHNLGSGGSKREAREFAVQLVRHGHTVHLYAPSTANEEFLPLNQVAQQSFSFELKLSRDFTGRLPLLRRYVNLARYVLNLTRLDKLAKTVARRIDSGGYDCALVHYDPIVQSPYVLRHLRTPSAFYCAEVNRGVYERTLLRPSHPAASMSGRLSAAWYAPADWTQFAVLKREDRVNLAHATRLLTNSYFTAESLYRAYGVRARVSYLGVDNDKFRPLNLERQNFVLSVGAVSRLKGYDFLIESLGRIAFADRPRLVIVGNTASTREVNFFKGLAADRGVQVEFRIDVSDDELLRLYNLARAFVYAPVLEPFGLVVLEAMACATPVVAVKEGGVRESVADGVTGLLAPRDFDLFAAALDRVLRDRTLAEAMGRAGRREIERAWTWEHAYGRLMQNLGDGSVPASIGRNSVPANAAAA
ncbi:MAG: glycosyltransferase family 4 protein [Chloroflexi bacterium]|nr:glycosyltransferase family 4 protein [Chloroflexota bacterium]